MNRIAYRFFLVGILAVTIFSSGIIMFFSPPVPSQPFTLSSSAFATFPGENGKIAFQRNGEIYVMNADGSGQTNISNSPTQEASPDWSPGGTKIAFISPRDQTNGIYVMNAADGSGQKALRTSEEIVMISPSWSPDGTKIAFAYNSHDFQIAVINAEDGSGRRILTSGGSPYPYTFRYDPDWSPDGTKIVYTSVREADGDQEISVMNATDGSGQKALTDNSFDEDWCPSWSPDGTKIAFASSRDGGGIYVMNAADGSGVTRLTNNLSCPVWSPDGTKIAFASSGQIYVMNAADGSGLTKLAENGDQLDWSPAIVAEPEEDTTAPVLTVPENIVVEATSEQVAQVTFTVTAQDDVDGTATLEEDGTTITQHDNIGGDITIACSPASGSIFPLGDSLIQCSARDATGNFVRGSFTVTVNSPPPPPDTTRPVIMVPEDITEEATSPDGATVSFEVSAQDDEDGPTDVECDHNSGETFPIGETVVTCSAEDLAGNRADEKSFTITVQDTTAPDVEITQASDRRRNAEIPDGGTTPINYIRITFEATDAVGIEKTECSLNEQPFTPCTSPVAYDRLSRSTHEFTVRATDAAGNTGEDEFSWTVGNPSAAAPGRQ